MQVLYFTKIDITNKITLGMELNFASPPNLNRPQDINIIFCCTKFYLAIMVQDIILPTLNSTSGFTIGNNNNIKYCPFCGEKIEINKDLLEPVEMKNVQSTTVKED